MVDIINTPAVNDNAGSGLLIGGILVVLFALVFIFWGLPALRGSTQNSVPSAQVQQAPRSESDVGSITIPDQIDVTVSQPTE